MTEDEYNLRMRVYKIGQELEGFEIDEDRQISLGKELISLSGVCRNCGGDGQDGDPPDAAGEGGWIGKCDCCEGKGFKVPSAS
jgi:hypothetical protein